MTYCANDSLIELDCGIWGMMCSDTTGSPQCQ
jgi:hypothetical protein